jgi:hypothetical protein
MERIANPLRKLRGFESHPGLFVSDLPREDSAPGVGTPVRSGVMTGAGLIAIGSILAALAWPHSAAAEFHPDEGWVDSVVEVGVNAERVSEQLQSRGVEHSLNGPRMLVILRKKQGFIHEARQWQVEVDDGGVVASVQKQTFYTGP